MATSTIKEKSIKKVRQGYFSTGAGNTTIVSLTPGMRYLLITVGTGYSIPNTKANMYMLGVTANYDAYTKLTANEDAITIMLQDHSELVLTSTNQQSRWWLFALS